MSLLGHTHTIATYTLTQEVEVEDPQEYAGHSRAIRVPPGTYEIKASLTWQHVYVYIAFSGTLIRDTWNGRPSSSDKPGDPAKVSSHLYIYTVARAAAGKEAMRGEVKLAEGWTVDPDDDGALVAPSGEIVRLGTVIRLGDVPRYREYQAVRKSFERDFERHGDAPTAEAALRAGRDAT